MSLYVGDTESGRTVQAQKADETSSDSGGLPSWFTNILNLAGNYYVTDKAAEAALEAGQKGAQEAADLGDTAATYAEFQPFTVTTGTGATISPSSTGGFSVTLSEDEKALQDALLSQASTLFSTLKTDPTTATNELYESIRDTQRPEEERARLALEERMLSQGRLGLQSAAYGGASPELLAQAKAQEEAKALASLSARQAINKERMDAFTLGSGLLKQAYAPQAQALESLGYGIESAKLADIGRRTGAELFAQLGQSGLEALMQGIQLATGLEELNRAQTVQGVLDSISGSGSGGGDGMLNVSKNWDDMNDVERIQVIDYFYNKYVKKDESDESDDNYVHPSEYDEDFVGPLQPSS